MRLNQASLVVVRVDERHAVLDPGIEKKLFWIFFIDVDEGHAVLDPDEMKMKLRKKYFLSQLTVTITHIFVHCFSTTPFKKFIRQKMQWFCAYCIIIAVGNIK